ncbi:hypothetical protein MOQ72_25400 [Saccharopolyspora sp. K220]|uniref:hypothetical protein n=1 Tax=Saccharopolyspora soli TaxID=2926618 RepID=UPI001F5A01F1|nr:hypothetical protein [Saccharopolyspora soli]MCI2420789.1 hypothetical protein [Saccharopolyspora soli]
MVITQRFAQAAFQVIYTTCAAPNSAAQAALSGDCTTEIGDANVAVDSTKQRRKSGASSIPIPTFPILGNHDSDFSAALREPR